MPLHKIIGISQSTQSLKSTIKVPSLDKIKTKIETPVEVDEVKPIQEITPSVNKEFTFEELRTCWSEYALLKKLENKPSELVILNQSISLSDHIITLKLSNPVQLEQLNNFKVDLLSFLRKKLQNFDLDINAVMEINEDKKMIYTSTEKFNYLIEKNPALLELKQKLGLELDF